MQRRFRVRVDIKNKYRSTKTKEAFYCRRGDIVNLISEDAKDWRVVVIVENSNKERFPIKTTDLKCES